MRQATYDVDAKAIYIYLGEKEIPEGKYLNTLSIGENINVDELRDKSTPEALRGIETANLESSRRELYGMEILNVELEDVTYGVYEVRRGQ